MENKELTSCKLCPHHCRVNRKEGQLGRCKSGDKVKIALVSTHYDEEPCISGIHGSGTIFFSNCNLNCIYCQNYEISQQGKGKEYSISELADIFLKQQERRVENINLVTPTSYVPQIIEAIRLARSKGLKIPIVYNTNSYEDITTIKMLEGYIDIYLADLKYADNQLAKELSNGNNYFEIATKNIEEMRKQIGKTRINQEGIMQKGLIIRHLILPNHILNTRKVLRWISDTMPEVYVSIMAQYFPTYKSKEIEKLNRQITEEEYKKVEKYIYRLPLESGYLQERGEKEEEYVPKWD